MAGLIARLVKTLGIVLMFNMSISIAVAAELTPISPEDMQNIRNSQAECLQCHSEEGFAALEQKDFELAQLQGLFVDKAALEASSHGRVDCLACHVTGYKEYPHFKAAKSIINNCDECHTRLFMVIEEQYFESVHHKQMKQKFDCNTCHDPHTFLKASRFATVGEAVAQDNAICVQCHGITKSLTKLSNGRQKDLEQTHDWLPNLTSHWEKVRCVDCHTKTSKKALSHNIMDGKGAQRDCVNCHQLDSDLLMRQYAHLVEQEREKYGFVNSIILNEAYVIGATRNRYIDLAFGLISILVLAGIGIHILIRIVARRRRNNSHD